MKKILIAVATLILTSGSASATDKMDAMAIAQKWADTFNKGDFKSDAAVCADDAVIVDDFSPHVAGPWRVYSVVQRLFGLRREDRGHRCKN